MRDDRPTGSGETRPKIVLPPDEPVTPEEIERRQALFARVIARREAMDPIGISADDLIHELRGATTGSTGDGPIYGTEALGARPSTWATIRSRSTPAAARLAESSPSK